MHKNFYKKLCAIALTAIILGSSSGLIAYATDSQVYRVTSVVDGDTFKIRLNGRTKKVRLIGIDAPETRHPTQPVGCYGRQSSNKLKQLLLRKNVRLGADSQSDDQDRYGRLLRYVYLPNNSFVNEYMVKEGYARAYLNFPFDFSAQFQQYETEAQNADKGLWGACNQNDSSTANTLNNGSSTPQCLIKGNISSTGEKIYHLPNGRWYETTVIDESAGERWFCSEAEAQTAGWRRSAN